MEESKELQTLYSVFRITIYVLLLFEFLVFVPFPFVPKTEWIYLVVSSVAKMPWYDNLIYSRMAILMMVIVTSIGTKAKKQIQYNPTHMVAIPLMAGLLATIISIILYSLQWKVNFFGFKLKYILYIISGVSGTVAGQVALDTVRKLIKN